MNKKLSNSMQTPFGELFSNFLKTYKAMNIASYNNHENQIISSNSFFNNLGDTQEFIFTKLIVSKDSGIHQIMIEHQDTIKLLIGTLEFLIDFSHLVGAFKQAFSLAGDGGDILIYIGLCKEITQLITCFSRIFSLLLDKMSEIRQKIDDIYYNLMLQQEFEHPWKKSYHGAKRFLNNAKENLTECNKYIQILALKMQDVHSRDYEGEVKERIAWFQITIAQINKRLFPNTELPLYEGLTTSINNLEIETENLRNNNQKQYGKNTHEILREVSKITGKSYTKMTQQENTFSNSQTMFGRNAPSENRNFDINIVDEEIINTIVIENVNGKNFSKGINNS